MANPYADRGGETVTTKSLGNGTVGVSTVPGDGKVKASLPEQRNGRSAAHFSKPQQERFGS